MGAINLVAFSKADILVEDILGAIEKGGAPVVSDDMGAYREAQINLITELKNILKERGTDEYKEKHPEKANFLGQFVNFCTGQWTIPRSCRGDFNITIEFHPEFKEDNLPVAHTCVNVIGFPAQAYDGSRKTLEEKLDISIAESRCSGREVASGEDKKNENAEEEFCMVLVKSRPNDKESSSEESEPTKAMPRMDNVLNSEQRNRAKMPTASKRRMGNNGSRTDKSEETKKRKRRMKDEESSSDESERYVKKAAAKGRSANKNLEKNAESIHDESEGESKIAGANKTTATTGEGLGLFKSNRKERTRSEESEPTRGRPLRDELASDDEEKFNVQESHEENVSGAAFLIVKTAYKDYWDRIHTSLGMRTTNPVKNIVFKVPQDIKLQEVLDAWYQRRASYVFCDIANNSSGSRERAKCLLSLSTVELELNGKREYGKSRKLKKETTAVDAGGVTREFFSQVWRQMGGLQVKYAEEFVKKGKHAEAVVSLFDGMSQAGCIPVQDETTLFKLKELTEEGTTVAVKRIEAYYRAIGRLMIHWLATDPHVSFQKFEREGGMQCGHVIDERTIPALYRYVLFRGLSPKDDNYPFGELVDHVLQLIDSPLSRSKDSHKKEQGLKQRLDVSDRDELRHYVQEFWVDDRSIALAALKEGLTLGGFVDLSVVFNKVPICVINQIAFSKAVVLAEDVIDAIDKAGPPAVSDNTCHCVEAQENLIMELKNIMKERGSHDYKQKHPDKADFLGQFVNFCTGLWSIPYSYHGDFKIVIEFQAELGKESLPIAHACVNVIVFPAQAYNGSRETLEEKLDLSIALSGGSFSMQ